ncbi:MAG TPA: potassium channel family protein, partial [Pirellulales bacterium]|nr:potassium channel family protein [Pirellulales bacterium]
ASRLGRPAVEGTFAIMHLLVGIASVVAILLILADSFEAMLQPRRVTHRFRFTRLFYRNSWMVWRAIAGRFHHRGRREAFLSLFGPLSLLVLFMLWAIGMIFAFGMLHWALDTRLAHFPDEWPSWTYVYLSGVTFFTLGYGDFTPLDRLGQVLAVVEAGVGFGLIALVIGYLPTLFQAFSQRERTIGLLDARAGSPPTASELLGRLAAAGRLTCVEGFLQEWEAWSADLLDNHLSFPMLSFYRSQHENQSWLAALTVILDTCSLLLVGVKQADRYHAQLTFAMARHAAVDLALVLWVPPVEVPYDRLPPEKLAEIFAKLRAGGCSSCDTALAQAKLAELRAMYEPVVYGLSQRLMFNLPTFAPDRPAVDNWQTSPWSKRTPGIGNLPSVGEEHFA